MDHHGPFVSFFRLSWKILYFREQWFSYFVALCYFIMNFSVHLFWDIRNGPFLVKSATKSFHGRRHGICNVQTLETALALLLLFFWMDPCKFVCRIVLCRHACDTVSLKRSQHLITLPPQRFRNLCEPTPDNIISCASHFSVRVDFICQRCTR